MVVGQTPYCFVKRGYFYFVRYVPADLLHHYQSHKISYSLRTKSHKLAVKRALIAAGQLDEYWDKLRDSADDIPLQHLALNDRASQHAAIASCPEPQIKMSEAVEVYLRLKGHNRPKTFATSAERATQYLFDKCGNKHLGEYTKKDATSFRDALFDRGLNGASVARIFGTVKSIFSFAANESGLVLNNPFSNVYFDRKVRVSAREPISTENIKLLQEACFRKDDPLRWLIAIVSDTGMRLAEAAGLSIDDIHLTETGTSTVEIKPHPWRRLKTDCSARTIPLVGASLWAAERIIAKAESVFAFPRYNIDDMTNSNSASAALNKWLKNVGNDKSTMHGFRHSMRDRLRDVGAQSELIDQIGGWSGSGNVGQSYGQGYTVEVMHKWMTLIVLD